MTETLLVPLDGSRRAEAALRAAVRIAPENDSIILAVHVLPPIRGGDPARDRKRRRTERRRAAAYLSLQGRRIRRHGVDVRLHVGNGDPSMVVTALAKREDAEMIVLSGRGHGGAPGPLGSVAERIVQASSVPVLLLRGDLRRIRTLLLPPGCGPFLVARAGRLARAIGAKVVVAVASARSVPSQRRVIDILTRLGVFNRIVSVPGGSFHDLEPLARRLEVGVVVAPSGIGQDGAMASFLRKTEYSLLISPSR